MKKNLFCLAALCAAALVSCTPKELVIDEPKGGEEKTDATELVHVTINASMDEATKAYIDDADGFGWKWAEGDQLAVFDASNSKIVFTINSTTVGSAVAKFEADGVPSTFVPAKAVFPASAAGATPDEFSIKPAQSPSTHSIDPAAMVATADGEKVSDTEFNFYFDPAVSYFRFKVAAGVKKVILHTVGKDDTIAGESRSVTVNLPGTAGSFWAAVNPAVYHGIRAFAYDGTSYAKKGADAAEIDLSAKGSGKNIGTVSGGTEVTVIENADNLISYLGNPALDGYIVNDLDLTGKTITSCASFENIFDGQYHSIRNWTTDAAPMFNVIASNASVMNLSFDSTCSVSMPSVLSDFGSVVNTNKGAVDNISFNGSISVPVIGSTSSYDGHFGAIVGVSSGAGSVISNCASSSVIAYTGPGLVSSDNNLYIGGITGRAEGQVVSCSFEGDILFTYTDATMTRCLYAAGICGNTSANASFELCTNKGTVGIVTPGSGIDCLFACGIVGYCGGTIDQCVNEGDIFVYSESADEAADGPLKRVCAAGISGYSSKAVTNCTNKGPVTLRGGYSTGLAVVGSLTKVSSVAAGITGLTFNANVSECTNLGTVRSILKNIDNAASDYNTDTRATIGGIVGNQQGTIEKCENKGEVEAYWVTSAHNAALAENFVSQAGGITGGSYNSVDKTKSSIISCTNSGTVKMTCDSNRSNNTLGGIVGWPGSESGMTGSITNCNSIGTVIADGFGLIRTGGISGGTGPISGGKVSGTITIAGNIKGSYVGGVAAYCAKVYTIQDVLVDNLVINYSCSTPMNSVVYGIGGLIGQPQNVNGAVFGQGCSVLVTINSNHSRDIGFLGGRNTNQSSTNTMTFGSAEKPVTVKKGCKIVVNGNTVAEIATSADADKVVTTAGSVGNLMGALWYDKWGQYFTKYVSYAE